MTMPIFILACVPQGFGPLLLIVVLLWIGGGVLTLANICMACSLRRKGTRAWHLVFLIFYLGLGASLFTDWMWSGGSAGLGIVCIFAVPIMAILHFFALLLAEGPKPAYIEEAARIQDAAEKLESQNEE